MKKIYALIALALMLILPASAQKAAMLQLADASPTEQAALQWFSSNSKGDVITSLENLYDYSVLWVIVDRQGLERGVNNLPITGEQRTTIANWVKDGGNLMLTNHATQLVEGIGRTDGYLPGIYGNGGGGQNADVWGLQPVIGNADGQIYNHRTHPVYSGLTFAPYTYGHDILPFIGSGHKNDRNCMWDLNAYGQLGNNPNKVKDFENKTNSDVLGTWQQVVDYCCAGLVEFKPTSEFNGTVLACGVAAYDWGAGAFETENMKGFSANMIAYLLTKGTPATPGGEVTPEPEPSDPDVTIGSKTAMLKIESGISDTERNAIAWFADNNKGDVITSLDNLSDYKVLWVMIDRVGLAKGYQNLPLTEAQRTTIANWVKAGGNLLVSGHATQLVEAIGRTSGYAPNEYNSNSANFNQDTWGITPVTVENRSHVIYSNLASATFSNGNFYYPLITAGTKLDHNCMWKEVNQSAFESANNAKCLGTWQQESSFNFTAVVEFNPTQTYQGRILAVGIAAFDWQAPAYKKNIRNFAANMLQYLYDGTAAEPEVTPQPQAGLVAHFNMEVSNNQIKDVATDATYGMNHRLETYSAKGATGNCVRFDGYSNFANVTIDTESMASRQLTLSLWCAPQTYPSVTTMDDAGEGWTSVFGNNAMAFRMSSRGQYAFDCRVGGQDVSCLVTNRMPCSEWNHLVAVINGDEGKVTLYNNGVKVAERTSPAGDIELGNNAFVIGKDLGGPAGNCYLNTFCGLIDEVKVYNGIKQEELADNTPANAVDMNYDIERRYGNNILRPRFHGMPDGNWTNETHGLTYYDGKYHVFFQKNANAPIMCHMQWGHITSKDLFTWKEEKVALMPLDNYDFKGTWSGDVFQHPDFNGGMPTILYTAVDNAKASIAMASPTDEHLLNWRKDGQIVSGKPQGLSDDFRDPNFFTANGKKYFIVGTAKDGRGACTLHRYENGQWTNDGSIFFHPAAGNGTFWEMPNVTPMGNDKYLFTVTPLGTSVGVKTIYWIGTINADGTFNPLSGPYDFDMAGTSKDGYGLLSPSIYQKDGKTLCLGIVPDKVAGELNAEWGWAHNYSLPRELSLSSDGTRLVQKPFSGLTAMRTATAYNVQNIALNGAQSLGEVNGRQVEFIGEFTANGGEQGFRFFKNGDRYAKLSYNDGKITLNLNSLDRIAQDNVYSGIYESAVQPKGGKIKIHAYLDGSIIDIFVNDESAFSVRLFPTDSNATAIEAFSTQNTTATLQAWTLKVADDDAPATEPEPEPIPDPEPDPEPEVNSFEILDRTEINVTEDTYYEDGVSFKKSFSKANVWCALYVPMSIDVTEYADDMDFAQIYAFCPFKDTNNDGVVDANDANSLIVNKMATGTTIPNTPYLVRSKQVQSDYEFSASDNKVYRNEVRSIECSTTTTTYTISGVNTPTLISGASKIYITANGGFSDASKPVTIAPYRWIITATPKAYGQANSAQQAKLGDIVVIGEDADETTAIKAVENASQTSNDNVYTLDGRKVMGELRKGIYIKNGKKIIIGK